MKALPVTAFLIAAAIVAGPVAAQTAVNQSHPLSSGGRVEIDNVAGEVRVRGWDRNEVSLTGELGPGQRLEVQSSANRVQLRVVYPQNRSSDGAQLELRVPRGVDLQAQTVSATLDMSDVDVKRLQAQTVSGSLTAQGKARESQLSTVSGSLTSRVATERLRANTVSGRLRAEGGPSGDVSVQTVSGSIGLQAGQVSRLRAETVSGSMDLGVARFAPGGSIDLQTVSGRIDLGLPKDVSAQLRVETFSGDIQSDAGEVQRPEYGPGRHLDVRLGGGNGDIDINSHSGSVRVRRGG
ncbi:DUF4097 family beta strand repeat-containing protein [Stenotrophomonas sp. HITSZ_GD]|uniref:DUF4097 family beta strand repeat-containing protein n=1 Tax=Stenotrophomonas sp. HITSZ_GD TaxID=3037248 RepID=UPI00240D56A6|nr:DUF4097 family beta strand repeat-containing protein [Stenotrophomonas sp. HITSZ_GD]MDG2527006.1 DUF4097 family beta strand repeat-containing protein [Stenotrophomonas sp. HITSZ_GD]